MTSAATLDRWRHRCALAFSEAGWPLIVAACLVFTGIFMWVAGNWLDKQTLLIRQSSAGVTSAQSHRPVSAPASPSDTSSLSGLVASRDWYLDDVEYVFGLANQHGIQIAGFAYEKELQQVGSFEVQGLSLRLKGEYPRLKAFLAGLMAGLPHSYLSDLRLDRGSPTALSLDGTLKISFIYRAKGANANTTVPITSGSQTASGPR